MDWVGDVWNFLFALSSGAWSAVATWLAVGVGTITILVTGTYAKRQVDAAQAQLVAANGQIEQAKLQLKEAEKARESQEQQAQILRKEQAQPNVVVFMEPTKDHWGFVDLIVKNFGATPARDVHLAFEPELSIAPITNAADENRFEKLGYPAVIPFLAPGQEWRTLWDSARRRNDEDKHRKQRNAALPADEPLQLMTSRFDATVTFKDSDGESLTTTSILDWEHLNGRMTVDTKTVHHLAKSVDKQMREMNKRLAGIGDSVNDLSAEGTGVWIYQGDVQELRAYYADQAERARERHEEVMRMLGMLDPSQTEVQPARGEPDPPAEPDQDAAAPAEQGPSTGA